MRIAEQETETVITTPAAGVVVRSAWQRRILTFLMVFGPGLIVMEADNDAGAVSTYMQAGGQYGLHLLWLLVVLLPKRSRWYAIDHPHRKRGRPKSKRGMEKWKAKDASHFPTPPTAARYLQNSLR
jgi:hypothetical protein